MPAPLLWRHFAELQSAPVSVISVAAAGSFVGQIAAVLQAAPLWVYLVAAVAPWLPILTLEIVWTYRHYRWLAVFCLLLVSQAVYLIEHVARITQIHVLGRSPVDAPGILGALGIERVHFLWTTWAVLSVLLLVQRFPRNPWLWVLLPVSAWDAVDHALILASYVSTGVGAVGVGRAELQFVLSIVELSVLSLAFAYQLSRTYDAWLARAFPQLPERVLIETTGRLEELRLRPGQRVEPDVGRCYVVTRGRGMLLRPGPGGHDILLRILSPGQVIRDRGTLHAETALELLALPPDAV
jgi:hypothetical protein